MPSRDHAGRDHPATDWIRVAAARNVLIVDDNRTNLALMDMLIRKLPGCSTLLQTDANALLRKEVAERKQTEKNLRAAQDGLVHAGKMAVLGQLAASITHELTQPLGAIRTLSGNAAEFLRRGNAAAAQDNLSIVSRLVEQMGRRLDVTPAPWSGARAITTTTVWPTSACDVLADIRSRSADEHPEAE